MSSKGYELVQLAKSLVVDTSGTITDLNIDTTNIDNLVNINLAIAPEVLEIQVDAPDAGQATVWKWTWEQSTLPYARRTITNSNELNVPLYKEGTYVVNNFAAYDIHGSMTQTHSLYLKWVDGAGTDNLVSWATSAGPISDTHPDINGGAATDVQRITVNVPSTITPPTLTNPSVAYTVVNNGSGGYTFSGSATGDNPNLGPFYRGGTYTINITATGHPFYFTTDNGTNFAAGTYFGEYTSGVTGSRNETGTITFTVPANAPDTLYYQCGNHSVMRGEITVKDLAVETNINGNYVVYFQHTQEGHKTAVELRPIPSLVNQMCLVYDSTSGKFVPQDLATYVENTPSFENKIREVAGTAELVVADGSAVIAKVNVYADSTYLPLTGNNAGDQAFATDTDILYIWDGSAWQQAGAANSDDLTEGSTNIFFTDARADARIAAATTTDLSEGTNLYYTDARADARAQLKVDALVDAAPGTLDTLNELAAALGDDPNFATTTANNIATKLSLSGGAMTGPITTTSTIDGRDIAADGTKLDGIETGADVTDTANVTAAGALMDSEVTNLAQVKAFDSSDYATAAQGTLADNALPLSGGAITGPITTTSTIAGRDIATDGAKLDGIEAGADVTDTTNVTAAGALMDSEVTNLAQVKAFDSSDYATAAQGTLADNALPLSGGNITGDINVSGQGKFTTGVRIGGENLRLSTDGSGEFGLGYGATHTTANRIRVYQNTTPVFGVRDDGAIDTEQVRHSVRPTLNLDFANSKELDPRITFYRDSIAAYYDSKGVLRYANTNIPRFDHDPVTGESKGLLIEEERTNTALATTLEVPLDFNTMYIQKYMEVAPDGTYSGHHVLASPGVSRHEVNVKYSGTNGVTYTISIWIKPLGSVDHVNFSRAGGTDLVRYNLTGDGSIVAQGGSATGTIKLHNNGWYRLSITYQETDTGTRSTYMSPGIGTNASSVYTNLNGDGSNGIAVWGMQVEQASFATSYIPSDTRFTSRSSAATYRDETGILRTAPANSPRYGYKYDGRKWVETGLILETASTNMLYHSTKGSDLYGDVLAAEALWTITDSSTDVTAPDGSSKTTKGVSGTSGNSWYWQVSPFSYTNGTTYTHSAWVRTAAGTTGTISMNVYPQTLASGGAAATSITATDEWQRVSVTFPYNSGLQNPYIGFVSPQHSRTFYFWGWQIEEQNQPTSYIKTLGSAVTRAADVASSVAYTRPHDIAKINNITNQDWYNTREGSIYTDFYPLSVDGNDEIVVCVEDGTSSRGFRAPWITSGGQIRIGNWSGSSYTALHYYNGITIENPHKSALSFSYEDAKFISSLDGSAVQSTSSWGGVETDADTIWLGGETETHRPYNGHIAKVSIYNEALTGTELQALTENN